MNIKTLSVCKYIYLKMQLMKQFEISVLGIVEKLFRNFEITYLIG